MIMPQDWHDRSHELRQDWFCGNEEAIAFIAMFFDAARSLVCCSFYRAA